jgi:hypothetical protein
MVGKIQQVIDQVTANPRRLLLIDCLGALVTAGCLAFVLAPLETYFGMPRNILFPLAIAAGCFALYSGTCYFLSDGKRPLWLTIIATANLLYCCVTAWLLFQMNEQLTPLGLIYFILEILVILVLVRVEYMAVGRNSS